MVFTSWDLRLQEDILQLDLEGPQESTQLLAGETRYDAPELSPDGTLLAYTSNESRAAPPDGAVMVRASSSSSRSLAAGGLPERPLRSPNSLTARTELFLRPTVCTVYEQ
jgi:Tol biopolymer transport system component